MWWQATGYPTPEPIIQDMQECGDPYIISLPYELRCINEILYGPIRGKMHVWLIIIMISFPEISAWCMLFNGHPGSSPAPRNDLFMQFMQMQPNLNDIWPPAINQLTSKPTWNQRIYMTYTHRHTSITFSLQSYIYEYTILGIMANITKS